MAGGTCAEVQALVTWKYALFASVGLKIRKVSARALTDAGRNRKEVTLIRPGKGRVDCRSLRIIALEANVDIFTLNAGPYALVASVVLSHCVVSF